MTFFAVDKIDVNCSVMLYFLSLSFSSVDGYDWCTKSQFDQAHI